jgi:hypothetical protein
MGIQEPEQDSKNSKIQDLIQKYKKVFQDLPMDLPPQRRIEHLIEIKPGSSPVKIKPYRYPHHHKRNRKISSRLVKMWDYHKK